MPITETDRSKRTVEDLANRFRGEMVPLGGKFSYFTGMPVAEEDLKQYLNDPIAALPPAICQSLTQIGVILVPYLEKGNGKEVGAKADSSLRGPTVSQERNGKKRSVCFAQNDNRWE